MRIVKQFDKIINKKEFEEKLGVKIKNWIRPADDNFLKIYTDGNLIIYLRCDDMKSLFDFDTNIFDDEDVKINENEISMKANEEIYKGKIKSLNKINLK